MINSQGITNLNSSDTKDNSSHSLNQAPHTQNFAISRANNNSNNTVDPSSDIATKFSTPNSLHCRNGMYQTNSIYWQFLCSHDKWPANVERAFISSLRLIIKSGTSKTKIRNRNYGRNELISLFIKFHTGETRTKKQISSHIQVWKKSILGKLSSNITLTPLESEVLNLIENGAEQSERSLSLFYSVFNEIIDAINNDKKFQRYKDTVMGPSRNNSNNIGRSGSNKTNMNSNNNTIIKNDNATYYQQNPQQQQQQQILHVPGQPVVVQDQNVSGSSTYSILQNVPVMFVSDNLQPNILRPVTYIEGPFVIANGSTTRRQPPQQKLDYGNNAVYTSNIYNNTTHNNVPNMNPDDANKNIFDNNFNNENKSYQTYPYNHVDKPWPIPDNNVISSSSLSSPSSGTTISYPQWSVSSIPPTNGDKTTPSRTHGLFSTSNYPLFPMRSREDKTSRSRFNLNDSSNMQNVFDSANTYSPNFNSLNGHFFTNNNKIKLPPVAENRFFRANNDMLKSAALPSIPHSSYPMFYVNSPSNENANETDNFNNYSNSREIISSKNKEGRKSDFNMNNNIIHKKSISLPHNFPNNINRRSSATEDNITILPPLSMYRISDGSTNDHITGNQEYQLR